MTLSLDDFPQMATSHKTLRRITMRARSRTVGVISAPLTTRVLI